MGHKHDYWEGFRQWLIPKLGTVTQLLEDVTGDHYYVKSEMHNTQFVGRVPMGEEDFEEKLHEMGFVRNPLASLKTLGVTDEVEEGSWRKVGFEDHPNYQLHVIVYDGEKMNNAQSGVTYVYAHWEKRWDTNPSDHYRAVGYNGPEGVRRVKRLLDEHGVGYEPIRP